MPTVAELTAPYGNFMLSPRPGPGVCRTCFNLTEGYDRCYACTRSEPWLDAVAPISYSVAHEQLHLALAAYKRAPAAVAHRFQIELAAVLWRHVESHEACVARRAGAAGGFDLVTTVPSSDRAKAVSHPLRKDVVPRARPLAGRLTDLLERSETPAAQPSHTYDRQKFRAKRRLGGEAVLLIDDTWTTGANAQSAAAALKAAGAGRTAIVVIGRHVNRDWHDIDRRLRALASPFDWDRCPLCPESPGTDRPDTTAEPKESYSTRSR